MDCVSESYERLLAPKISVENGIVWIRAKSQTTLPIRATPSNIADLSLLRAVTIAVNKPSRWKHLLPEAICVAQHFWELAGAKLEPPGRGEWKLIMDSFDSSDASSLNLASFISKARAPSLPLTLRATIIRAAMALACRLRS